MAEQNAVSEQNRKQQEEAIGQAKQSVQQQANIQRNLDQTRNVPALEDAHLALQQQEAALSKRIGELKKLPKELSVHSYTGNPAHASFSLPESSASRLTGKGL